MRYPTVVALAGLTLVGLAACNDASRLTSPETSNVSQIAAPGQASLTSGSSHQDDDKDRNNDRDRDNDRDKDHDWNNDRDDDDYGGGRDHDWDKVTICHAAGRAGTTKYVSITVSRNAAHAHIDDHGTPRAGHEQDYYSNDDDCSGKGTIVKKLVEVKKLGSTPGSMIDDPAWSLGKTSLVIPAGETRWLFYRIDYSLPNGKTGTITEDASSVCATAGSGIHCSFNTSGKYSWTVKGSGSKIVQIDLSNNSACSDRTFINTVKLTGGGTSSSASASLLLKLDCGTGTITKVLDHVMTTDAAGNMILDGTYANGVVTIPAGQTRWMYYKVNYSLPAGVTGVLTENETDVCNTMGAADVNHPGMGTIACSFNWGSAVPVPVKNGAVFTWSGLKNSGSVLLPIDISNGGLVCGDRTFKNTAILVGSNGKTYTAVHTVTVRFPCPPVTISKKLIGVMTLDAAGNMIDDPTWSGGAVTVPAGQTRWLDYQITYSLPAGMTGTISENEASVCSTMGAADVNHPGDGKITCSFNWGMAVPLVTVASGVGSWSASGSGTVIVPIDVSTGGLACGSRTLTNTATLKTSTGATYTGVSTTVINFGTLPSVKCP